MTQFLNFRNTQPPQIKEVLKEQLPEEVPTREAKKVEPAASFPSTSVVPEKTATPVAESNQATPSTAATAETVGVATPPQLSRQIEEEKSNHKTENRIGDPKTETIEQTDKNDSKTQEIEEKMSNLNTKNETTSVAPATPSENQMGVATDIEDRPQPPEFDTVPDVDDLESDDEHENATAIVDNDDENDDL